MCECVCECVCDLRKYVQSGTVDTCTPQRMCAALPSPSLSLSLHHWCEEAFSVVTHHTLLSFVLSTFKATTSP